MPMTDQEYEDQKASRIRSELLERADFPGRHKRNSDFGGHEWLNILSKLKEKRYKGFLSILVGVRGTGKTQMAVELGKSYIQECAYARYLKAMSFFIRLKESYRKDSSLNEQTVLDELIKPEFLIIDEVHERSDSEWENRMLTHLIDNRYGEEKDTILIGNIKASELVEKLGSSIASRMVETGGVIECNWESYRK